MFQRPYESYEAAEREADERAGDLGGEWFIVEVIPEDEPLGQLYVVDPEGRDDLAYRYPHHVHELQYDATKPDDDDPVVDAAERGSQADPDRYDDAERPVVSQ